MTYVFQSEILHRARLLVMGDSAKKKTMKTIRFDETVYCLIVNGCTVITKYRPHNTLFNTMKRRYYELG